LILSALFDGQFQRYFDELLAHRALWLFVHIPKTAGSSMNGELVPILSPSHHIFVDYTQLDQRPFDTLLDEAVERFIAASQNTRFAYCTGHINAAHVARIAAALPNVRPITVLRDPVSRFVSDYRYQCSPLHPGHEQFKAQHPSIESYLELKGEWNKASHHLIPSHLREAADPSGAISHLLENYAYIGVQELYPLSLRLITTLAGAPRTPKVFKRVNTPTEENAVILTPALEARIRACNALDIAIYEALAARFRAIAPALTTYLDIVDPLPPDAA
jgi:hypothetical protein